MDNAASAGHLDVVKFLHENRTEGCTTRAMNKAAGNGHIGVVKFLHENRMEGCTVKAASDALYGGTEMVAFLFKHYRGFFGKDHLHDLLLYGAFETYKELAESYPDKPHQVVESVMLQSSEEGQLPTIRFIINDLGRKDVASIAMDGAASYSNYCSRAQWIRAVSAVTGGQSCTPSAFENTACKANTESPELHPFLSDPRAPMWAIRLVLDDMLQYDTDPYWRGSLTWPIRAAYHGDLTPLEILRDLKEQGYGADDSLFSFDGARAAAIREGNLELLQWMIINIDLPVEPTLLDEAVFYHKYDIAEWIVTNHPEACRELVWQGKTYIGRETSSVFDDGLLDWIESTENVRTAINIGGIIDYAVHYNYVDELRRLHSWGVEKFLARPGLMAIARDKNHDAAVQFLEEIGYEQ